ncbi:MAG: tyrosine-type recombinase/integrase, partial [Deltaproteobacteria bacterium]|nr:tyrosine-type recombinase/integrase [Deltaproteobacteria bacterium]
MSANAIEILPAIYEETFPVLKTQDGREIKYIRRDEVHRVLSFVEGRDKLFVDLLWNTGARVSEALDITPGGIDFNESTITVRTLKKKKRLPKMGKDLKNEIRGLELALRYDLTSKILQKKLEQAKQRLLDVEEA